MSGKPLSTFVACLMTMVSGLAVAQSADRAEKIRALMEAQGLVETFAHQIEISRENCRKQADQMLGQMFSQMDAPEAFITQMKVAADDFITALQAPWSAKDIVDAWAAEYGPHFTDAELDQLLTYYRSPLAQKEAAASREAMGPLSAHFQGLYAPIMEQATKSFVTRVQTLAKECNCAKKKLDTP